MIEATQNGINLPYTMANLVTSNVLLGSANGYTNIIRDLTDVNRIIRYNRKGNSIGFTKAERLVLPPI